MSSKVDEDPGRKYYHKQPKGPEEKKQDYASQGKGFLRKHEIFIAYSLPVDLSCKISSFLATSLASSQVVISNETGISEWMEGSQEK